MDDHPVPHRHFQTASYAVVFLVLIDYLTKKWVIETLGQVGVVQPVTPWFNFVYVENRGITFGILNNINPAYSAYALSAMAGVIVLLLGRWLWTTTTFWLSVGLSMVMAGAIGNIIDRLQHGAVTDFLDFHAYGYHWYAFNVADASICLGVIILMLDSVMNRR